MYKPYEQVGVAITSRGFDEYVRMFDLKEENLAAGSTLDIAGGGASFTADMRAKGYEALAVDPRYAKPPELIIEEAEQEIETSTAKIAAMSGQYDWTYYGSIEQHCAGRVASLKRFAAHIGQERDRYLAGSLPELPFADGQFSLVLCSHFLFLYEDQFGYEFHLQSILEMMRVCAPGGEVRIYPIRSLRYEQYSHLDQLIAAIRSSGAAAELFRTRLPFIPGSELGLLIKV